MEESLQASDPQADQASAPPARGSAAAAAVAVRPVSQGPMPGANPLHTSIESTLAPTGEFARYFLLALPARYLLRGLLGKGQVANNAALGVASAGLTASYSNMAYHDMFNLFAEAVSYETGKDPQTMRPEDLNASPNRIIAKTLDTWEHKRRSRFLTDALFLVAPLLYMIPSLRPWLSREMPHAAINPIESLEYVGLGVKGVQIFAETWKRKTSLFEQLAHIVNNKINPEHGLGQPITQTDIFDLYQRYHFEFSPDRAFKKVVDTDPVEAQRWAGGEPVFERITELLNLTYSFKHSSALDAQTGRPLARADFPLPKFIYLLGHDLIDMDRPAQTRLYIEAANQYGMGAVRDIETQLAAGVPLEEIQARYPVDPQRSRYHAMPAPQNDNVKHGPVADVKAPAAENDNPTPQTTAAALQGTLVSPQAALQV